MGYIQKNKKLSEAMKESATTTPEQSEESVKKAWGENRDNAEKPSSPPAKKL